MISRNFFETLERRQLLNGITVFSPAWDGGLNNWIATSINGITADLGGPQNVSQYVLTIAPNSSGTLVVQGETHVAGTATPQTSNSGQIILTVDYTSVSTNPDYPLSATAALVTNFMENDPVDGVTWADLPVHLISTSRGTGLSDAIAQSLDYSGIWVDQETYLDPDPDTSGPFLDPLNAIYDNVEFADDYWRQNPDGSNPGTNPSGHPIDGAYNLELTWVQADFSSFAIAHLAPPAWYAGTIDPSLIGGSDGQGTIQPDWYGDGSTPTTLPSATQTGFLYSSIEGGTRPLSGVWAASGGSGARTAVAHTGLQWPNVSDVEPTATTVQGGTTLSVNYIQEDQSEADNITFYLDQDQNPYDGAQYKLGTQTGLASSTSTSNGSFSASLTGVAAGTYYVVARVDDTSGLRRYDYSIGQVTVTPAITVTDTAHSNPNNVTGNKTHLIAAANDADGGANLTYTWAVTYKPKGAPTPVLSKSGTNASQKIAVTFFKHGGYGFIVTISDGLGDSITSQCTADVLQTPTKLAVNPVGATVPKGHARRFSTTVLDQFGLAIIGGDPVAEYSIVSGPATIGNLTGIFNAGNTTGTALIKVEDDNLSAIVDASVVN